MLSLESPTAKMYRLASTAVNGEPYLSLDDMLATVAALTADDMAGAAAEFFAPERQTVVSLGPTSKGEA
jgi:predicted Zn-dependent peptidase